MHLECVTEEKDYSLQSSFYSQHARCDLFRDSWVNFLEIKNTPRQLTPNQRQLFEWRLQVVKCVYGHSSMVFKDFNRNDSDARVKLEVTRKNGLKVGFSSDVINRRERSHWTMARVKCLREFLVWCRFYRNHNRSMLIGLDDVADHEALVSCLAKYFQTQENIPNATQMINTYPDFYIDTWKKYNSTATSAERNPLEQSEAKQFEEDLTNYEEDHQDFMKLAREFDR